MSKQVDDIEATLRTPEPALADDDFTASVLARLPPRRRRAPARRWTLAGAAALGGVLTLALSPPIESVIASLTPWSISPLVLSTVAAVAVVLIPALIVFYAERADR
jgi:hypothetical protein